MGQKTIVVGAGPVGALAALYAAQRGHEVEVYELRSDLRDPSTTPLNFTKSINLALSERGINAIKCSGRADLLESIIGETIPMRGRMIHGRDKSGELYEQGQDYDIHGRTLYAADRGGLNKILLDELESLPNVKFFFNHKLTGADFRKHTAWFEVTNKTTASQGRHKEIEVNFDFLIGADGAHSSTRYHLMKYTRMDYQQEYIDTLWCEFQITAKPVKSGQDENSRFSISQHHLHIWPGKEFMFIAIPSLDGSFTCTLFMPSSHFSALESNPSTLPTFFNTHFPGVTSLIPPKDLITSFTTNPHLPLLSIKCTPYHFLSSAVILGDAAHAMVPFYGQGMNAGLEDVRFLFSILDKHSSPNSDQETDTKVRATALAEYSEFRTRDAHAINDLALQNYVEMRASVVSPVYKGRKWLEEKLSVWVPSLGWATRYSRVSFGNERYSEVVERSDRQGRLLVGWVLGVLGLPVVVGAVGVWWRLRRGGRGWR
ncbi:FAD dependent oxidoreductase [Mollisia scopiformis]|uniref:Kynurenine 3-monooxygenase n=1 Tax=Mollisia scopiformis TaxID=149040 RepID=A0A194XUB3_MOLSC|nr:FAD dependent oxidoreductase [Mollisia scopiformis]KUJ23910.1 FAD dependent oxidoreductase [Mollisia scopiformis]